MSVVTHPSTQERIAGVAHRFMVLRKQHRVMADSLWLGMLLREFHTHAAIGRWQFGYRHDYSKAAPVPPAGAPET